MEGQAQMLDEELWPTLSALIHPKGGAQDSTAG